MPERQLSDAEMSGPSSPVREEGTKGSWLRRLGRISLRAFLGLVLIILNLWGLAALHFDFPVPWLRLLLTVLYLSGVLAPFLFLKCRIVALGASLIPFLIVLVWWFTLSPSNNRDWQPDVAILPYADISGDQVTIHNIRNCDYRTEPDYEVRHYDKTFDLRKLRSVDLYLVYWGSPAIAHTMVSFGFEDTEYVCVSIETRKEKGESYSAIRGFFRQFELTYVIGDERDLVRLRTNYRKGEEAYCYRINVSPEGARALFLSYLARANRLRDKAEWYNALTSNCTTNIRVQTDEARGHRSAFDWRILANGHGDELLYERGRIATNLPFADLKQRCHINARARQADKDPAFSQRIREGVPGT